MDMLSTLIYNLTFQGATIFLTALVMGGTGAHRSKELTGRFWWSYIPAQGVTAMIGITTIVLGSRDPFMIQAPVAMLLTGLMCYWAGFNTWREK